MIELLAEDVGERILCKNPFSSQEQHLLERYWPFVVETRYPLPQKHAFLSINLYAGTCVAWLKFTGVTLGRTQEIFIEVITLKFVRTKEKR